MFNIDYVLIVFVLLLILYIVSYNLGNRILLKITICSLVGLFFIWGNIHRVVILYNSGVHMEGCIVPFVYIPDSLINEIKEGNLTLINKSDSFLIYHSIAYSKSFNLKAKGESYSQTIAPHNNFFSKSESFPDFIFEEPKSQIIDKDNGGFTYKYCIHYHNNLKK